MASQGMGVKARVHIMPVGYEFDRIVLPAQELRADRVVLLDPVTEQEAPRYTGDVCEALDEARIDYELVNCDIFDLFESLGTIAKLATAYEDDDVYVNLASGSKVTAMGGMIACMATDAIPSYVRAEKYAEQTESGVSEGVAEISRVPTYPIERPSRQHVAVLDYIAEHEKTTKKSVIELGEEVNLPFIADYESTEPKGKYRLLDSRILQPLVENEYIEVEAVGRTKRISITENGRNTLQAFQYLLD